MQFRVPQFIDVEDKIFGPLTFKQFLYLVGGAGICFIIFKALPLILAIPLMIPFAGLAAALAFMKINDRPFINFLESYFSYAFKTKLYIWKQKIKKKEDKKVEDIIDAGVLKNTESRFTESKLRDLSWSLNVLDKKQK